MVMGKCLAYGSLLASSKGGVSTWPMSWRWPTSFSELLQGFTI